MANDDQPRQPQPNPPPAPRQVPIPPAPQPIPARPVQPDWRKKSSDGDKDVTR